MSLEPRVRLQAIELDRIVPSPHNPRILRDDDPGLTELAKSIAAVGLLSPVLVRSDPYAAPGERYILIAGERRFRACKLLDSAERSPTIPAIVRDDLLDDEALALTVTENLQREDLHPLEEANGVASLLGRGDTHAQVADRLGKSLSWVARRARLAQLSPRWRNLVADERSRVSTWSAEMLELVARLDVAAQDAFLGDYRPRFENEWNPIDAVGLRRLVGDLTRDIRSAPWAADDAGLAPRAGACTSCPKRSSCHPGLFDDEEADGGGKRGVTDRCLDAVCWADKLQRHMARVAADLQAKHGEVRFSGSLHHGQKPPAFVGKAKVLGTWDGEKASKSTPGAVPVMEITGSDAGKVTWRTFGKPAKAKAAKKAGAKAAVKPLAERRGELEARRRAHALESISASLSRLPIPPLEVVMDLVCVFGTAVRGGDVPGEIYDVSQRESGDPQVALRRRKSWSAYELLWKSVVWVLEQRWPKAPRGRGVVKGTAEIWPEIEIVAEMIALDLAPHLEAAAAAIPEPKSWAKLAEAEAAAQAAPGREAATKRVGKS